MALADVIARVKNSSVIQNRHSDTELEEFVTRAADVLKGELKCPGFFAASGYSKSATGASADITGLSYNKLLLSVNGSEVLEVALTLAGLNSGSAIASALQSAIQATADEGGWFEEVTVAFDASVAQYTLTSAMVGPQSRIKVAFDAGYQALVRALKLSPLYGGTEVSGSFEEPELQSGLALFVERMLRRVSLERAHQLNDAGLLELATSDADFRRFVVNYRSYK